MQPTHLVYLEDFSILENQAKAIEVTQEDGRLAVILDNTIFYPQGGGQPYDQGTIESSSGKFAVEDVRFFGGIVKHYGRFDSGNFEQGDTVICKVNLERRVLHSRLHTAGHIVDWAVLQLQLPWVPGKGYHFPDGPYVEYEGSIEGVDKEKLKTDVEAFCARFIAENRPCKLVFMDKEKMHEVCHHVPDFLPEGKPARVVMFGDFGVPCGGTHVKSLGEVGQVTIRKIKSNGTSIRVGYDVNR